MKEEILAAFKHLGFDLEEAGEIGYRFQYEGWYFLLLEEEDEDFINIALPESFSKDGVGEQSFYKVMNLVNTKLKYVKAYEVNDSLWLFYEREIIGEEDMEKVIRRMIIHLELGIQELMNIMVDNDTYSVTTTDDNDN